MERTIDIELLGRFRIDLGDGRTVDEAAWGRSRPLQLVQLLALAPGHRLVRDQVVDALWPELDPDAGAANLRKAAHHARNVLGDADAVVLRTGQVALFPDAEVRTDLEVFHRAAQDALAGGDADRCAAVADSVSGELLPGSLYDEWTVEPRRAAAATRLDLLRAAGRWADVVALEPADEAAYRALMRDALDDGRRAEAIRWYGAARAALADQLGVAPRPDIEALHREALAGLGTEESPLVGRELEKARATVALREGSTPRVGAVALRGPAGIGKSALGRVIMAGLAEDPLVVHQTTAADPHRPYAPLIDLVDDIVLERPDVTEHLVPHVRAVLSALADATGGSPLPLPLSRHQVVGAVTSVLRAVADGAPTVLFVDDLHDADDASVDVIIHLASSVDDIRVMVSYRPSGARRPISRGIDRLERSGQLLALDLTTLAPAQAEALVRGSAEVDLDEETAARIVSLGAGNPFALIELARSASRGVALPRTTAEAITNRRVGLEPDTMAMLERVALAGTDVGTATVAALAGTDEAETFALLDDALDAGVLVVTEDRYRFSHDLVREALASLVPPHRRIAAHREAAERLATLGAPAAAIARHWLAGECPDEAGPWFLQAAEEAAAVGAFVDARRHVRPLLDSQPGHPSSLRLEAECLDMLGDPAALAAYDAAIDVAAAEDVDDIVVNRALAQVKQGDPAGGLLTIRDATPRSTIGRINEALTYAGAAALGATDPATGTEKAAACRRLALESGDRGGIVIAAWAHAAAAHARGDLHDSVLADLRETRNLPELAVRVFDGHLCMTQRFLYGSRPYAEVISFAEDLTSEAERLDAARGRAFGVTLRGEARYLSGLVSEAEADLRAAVWLHRETGGTTGEAHAVQRLAEIAHHTGDHEQARARLDEALSLARSSDIGFHLLDRIYGSRISISSSREEALAAVEEAEDAVRGPLETCPGCRVHLAVPAAIASARAGDLDRATAYATAVDYLTDVVMRLPAWFAARSEVQANLALMDGDVHTAAGRFDDAASRFAGAGQPVDAERCRRAAAAVERP